MDMSVLVLAGLGGLAVCAVIYLVFRAKVAANVGAHAGAQPSDGPQPRARRAGGKKPWNPTLAEVAEELRLEVEPTGSGQDAARGTLGRIEVEVVPSDDGDSVRIEVDLLTKGRLCIRPRGSKVSGKKTGAATPTGDAAFDEQIEVLGASAALREALGDSELKALVRRVVLELGAVAVHNDIVLERPRASAATTLRADLDAMIRLARWLNEPNASKLSHVEAPLVPRFAGLGEDGEIPADDVREFLEEVGPSIGAGQLASDGNAPQWRGSLGGNPFRIRIDDGDVHAELKIASPMGNLELYWDPDEIPERTPEAQQVWDEEDAPVFVGRGVTISKGYSIGQDPDAVLPQRIAQWARLPDDTKAAVVATMSECDVHELVIDSAGIKAELRRKLGELFQPERSVVELARGLESIAKGLSGVQGTEGASPAAGVKIVPLNRETCAYCRSVFVWTTNAECPNCGAPVHA